MNSRGQDQDVLDSAESGAAFERLYAQAIVNPGGIETNVEQMIEQVRQQAQQERAGRSLYGETILDPALAQQMSSHPLPYWVERMTTAYLRSEGGQARRGLFGYSLQWPDGSQMEGVSFLSREAQDQGLTHLSMGDARVRSLVQQLPACDSQSSHPTSADCRRASGGCRVLVPVADHAGCR